MTITKKQYLKALQSDGVLRTNNVKLLNCIYDAPRCTVTAPQLAEMLGYDDFAPVNALIGNLGKRIAKYLGIQLPKGKNNRYEWWQIVANGSSENNGFNWSLKEELFEALLELNLIEENNPKLYPEIIPSSYNLIEGNKKTVLVNRYERNSSARTKCIEHYGSKCAVCSINFEDVYGEIGRDFIHVHHLIEFSTINKEYKVNPIEDLRPVCPNCHAMLHQRRPAYSIEELKSIITKNN